MAIGFVAPATGPLWGKTISNRDSPHRGEIINAYSFMCPVKTSNSFHVYRWIPWCRTVYRYYVELRDNLVPWSMVYILSLATFMYCKFYALHWNYVNIQMSIIHVWPTEIWWGIWTSGYVIIGSGNGVSPVRRQSISWTNNDPLQSQKQPPIKCYLKCNNLHTMESCWICRLQIVGHITLA